MKALLKEKEGKRGRGGGREKWRRRRCRCLAKPSCSRVSDREAASSVSVISVTHFPLNPKQWMMNVGNDIEMWNYLKKKKKKREISPPFLLWRGLFMLWSEFSLHSTLNPFFEEGWKNKNKCKKLGHICISIWQQAALISRLAVWSSFREAAGSLLLYKLCTCDVLSPSVRSQWPAWTVPVQPSSITAAMINLLFQPNGKSARSIHMSLNWEKCMNTTQGYLCVYPLQLG